MVIVSETVCFVPTFTLPNARALAESEIDDEAPDPVSLTRLEPKGVLVLSVKLELTLPDCFGAKATCMVVDWPDLSVTGNAGDASEKHWSEAAAPVIVIGSSPEFVAVRLTIFKWPGVTLPKSSASLASVSMPVDDCVEFDALTREFMPPHAVSARNKANERITVKVFTREWWARTRWRAVPPLPDAFVLGRHWGQLRWGIITLSLVCALNRQKVPEVLRLRRLSTSTQVTLRSRICRVWVSPA